MTAAKHTPEQATEHYTPGEHVEVYRGDARSVLRWIPGVVMSDAPYPKAGVGGAYVFAAGTEGWSGQNRIRRIAKTTGDEQ